MTIATQSIHPSDLWRGYWGIQVLHAGQILGLFELLREAKTVEEISGELHLERRYIELWCEAAVDFHLVEREGERFRAPEMYLEWLQRSGGFTQSHLQLSARMNETLRAVFGGRALPEPPISLRLLLQKNLQANYQWTFQEAASAHPRVNDILTRAGRVMEVGCGVGYGLSHLRNYHPKLELFGLESDYECAQEAERFTKAVIHVGEFPAERFSRDFDLIVCFRSLTASSDPKRLLQECAKLLHPSGFIVLGSEFQDEQDRRKGRARSKGERLAYNILAGEFLVNSYTRESLCALVNEVGLKVEREVEAPDWATPLLICSRAQT